MLHKWVHSTIMSLFLVLACSVYAAEAVEGSANTESPVLEQTPHQLVATVTDELLKAISTHKGTFDIDPAGFFSALDCLLKDVIDFEWIAYKVMGSYGRKAEAEQRSRFAGIFRSDLIETYGRGLMVYGEQSIVVIPPKEDVQGLRKVKVVQEIHGADGVFPLVYTMGLNRDGKWKVTNVVINGINLGKTFRNQFVRRAQKVDGDIEQVINNWSSSAG